MPTQSIPLACPSCGGGPVVQQLRFPPYCKACGKDIPLGPLVPTEADRLRAEVAALRGLVERAGPLVARLYEDDPAAAQWAVDADAVMGD